MRTETSVIDLHEIDEAFVSDSDLIGFFKPSEIVHDPVLTLARKRQLLAYWGSDIHAVAGAPALRTYAHGATVTERQRRQGSLQLVHAVCFRIDAVFA